MCLRLVERALGWVSGKLVLQGSVPYLTHTHQIFGKTKETKKPNSHLPGPHFPHLSK